jgi:phosphoenolpyruvate-protein phosphotransferase/dihydroxyacetone kinase phosphotransfer subunit
VVALVLVSHSKALAAAVRELALQMARRDFPIGIAAGVGDEYQELGTDAVHIAEVLREMWQPDGVLVLMDMGSAVLSAQTALELLEPAEQSLVRLSSAPLVEGAVIAAVQAAAGSSLDVLMRELDRVLIAKQDQIAPVTPALAPDGERHHLSGESSEIIITVANEHGLHARPAAVLVELTARFTSEIEITNLRSGAGPASARSLTSIALLQVRKGDAIRVTVRGEDRDAALRAVQEVAASGFGEPADRLSRSQFTPNLSKGVPASPGIAIGPLLPVTTVVAIPHEGVIGDPQTETLELSKCLQSVTEELRSSAGETTAVAAIQRAQSAVLGDPVLLESAKALILRERISASAAWAQACDRIANSYQAMDDPYLRERAADIRDVKQMVLRALSGASANDSFAPSISSILCVHELLPSEAAQCRRSQVLGVIAMRGSPTSHSAIILRAAGIPMVIGADYTATKFRSEIGAIDGSSGEVWIQPGEHVLERLRGLQQHQADRQQLAEANKGRPVVTLDGTAIEVMANVSSRNDAEEAVSNLAHGIGLLRTELLFTSLRTLSEAEQVRLLREALGTAEGPVLVRTVDVGGDKPLPSLPCAREDNPFLGVRGLRLTLRNLTFFESHLRAILRAGEHSDLWIMFPMVSSVSEILQAREVLERIHRTLLEEALPHAWPVKLGCMIEVPSAALTATKLAPVLDFFSIGTNDLTQYTMAAERGNAALADFQDALHPAVLQLVATVVRGAGSFGRHVSVCGEAASDPLACAVFLGLGIRSLSVAPRRIPEIKAWIRSLRVADLEVLSEQALECSNALEVRLLTSKLLASAGREVPSATHKSSH